MKYGYGSEAFCEMLDTAYSNGPTSEMTNFVNTGYRTWMKRKTYNEREAKAFRMFLEAVDEMKRHFENMEKKG